ncbi:MAG: NAD(P)/FAD-dependent oxidoreductase [Anaerolineales bacterium]|nr:NAD(P)/FAD-dependent oxidoreductase [Anaerolineales bacterium]
MAQADVRQNARFIIIGGGPAGLTAAYELTCRDYASVVLEKNDKVGGIARTEEYKGFYFDMGGHRFFTKSGEVDQIWREVMGDDFLRRPRLSRIYYKRKFFNYPLKPLNALMGLGIWEGMLIGLSYLQWQVFPYKRENSFEEWVTNRFGKRLFRIFFKSYTEKVWGIPTSELRAEWAAQRIKDLDLKAAILSMFVKPKQTIKTLIEEFDYPRRGPGMLWSQMKARLERRGSQVLLNSEIVKILHHGDRVTGVVVKQGGRLEEMQGDNFISSMAIKDFIRALDPPAPQTVLDACEMLNYREFLTVCLVINQPTLFDDNWIYIHEPGVKVGRIQNFKNWSPDMVPDAGMSSLGLEYFCNEGDELWSMADADLVELGKRELEEIGLARAADVVDGCVFRVEKAYPVYDATYQQHIDAIKAYIHKFVNFQTIGRNGLHRYNNQDHAMLTGLYAVRNMLDGETTNLWEINAEQDYHEEVRAEKQPDAEKIINRVFPQIFTKLEPLAFGVATGSVSAATLFLVTLWAFINHLDRSAAFLSLLNQYLPGYEVTFFPGALLGLLYGSVLGFVGGFLLASLRNGIMRLYVSNLLRQAEAVQYEETPSNN